MQDLEDKATKPSEYSEGSLFPQEKSPREIYLSVAEGTYKTLVDGRTAIEWKDYFSLTFPQDVSVSQIVETCSKTTRLLEEVYYYLSNAELRDTALGAIYNKAYQKAYAIQANSTKKKLAAVTLQKLAEAATTNTKLALDSAKSEVLFWKRRVEALKSQCNILEKITYLVSLEARTIKFNE